ncbi:Uncharacterized protein TCAP_03222 [Tolypocladium capitatum]|uniref:Rhodopsin domain-containing protein n=1 Tax=Tolypocladium capitatum TaxID=45235 RepID=A0A2K3QH78_9HYPO|nr:Uncharacterized protein TCAP_03222 [Tolypocladium capitatum]
MGEDYPELPEAVYWRQMLGGFSIAFFIISTIAFALRIYASRMVSSSIRVDDVLMGCAVLVMWGDTAGVWLSLSPVIVAYNGIGVPADLLPEYRQVRIRMGLWILTKCWAISMGFNKLSIILFLRRVLGLTRAVNMALVVVGVCVVIWTGAVILYTTFVCTPVPFYWDKSMPGGWCWGNDKFMIQNVVAGVLALALDIAILIIPVGTVWKLQIKRKQKMAVTLVLGVGAM